MFRLYFHSYKIIFYSQYRFIGIKYDLLRSISVKQIKSSGPVNLFPYVEDSIEKNFWLFQKYEQWMSLIMPKHKTIQNSLSSEQSVSKKRKHKSKNKQSKSRDKKRKFSDEKYKLEEQSKKDFKYKRKKLNPMNRSKKHKIEKVVLGKTENICSSSDIQILYESTSKHSSHIHNISNKLNSSRRSSVDADIEYIHFLRRTASWNKQSSSKMGNIFGCMSKNPGIDGTERLSANTDMAVSSTRKSTGTIEVITIDSDEVEAVFNVPDSVHNEVKELHSGNNNKSFITEIPLPEEIIPENNGFAGKNQRNFDSMGVEVSDSSLLSSKSRNSFHCNAGLKSNATSTPTRLWEFTGFGNSIASRVVENDCAEYHVFRVLSYNVLAQQLLEDHPFLYKNHDRSALNWTERSTLLMSEILDFKAEILCLQEVQASHLSSFYSTLSDLGYQGVYKQRTGNKVDGCAIYFKETDFQLDVHATVEFQQPSVPILDRDNVGLVVKLISKKNPAQKIVVATTHLLFNPRRHDIKLAQVQLLLAEVERLSFKGIDSRTGESQYWPVILSGDFNLAPLSSVYSLLTEGSLNYEGLCSKTLQSYNIRNPLGSELLPRYLEVTDTAQHLRILLARNMNFSIDNYQELALLKVYNSDHGKLLGHSDPFNGTKEKLLKQLESFNMPNLFSEKVSYNELENLPVVKEREWFGTGRVKHNFNFASVYKHSSGRSFWDEEVTTHQGQWLTVDYIFYSKKWSEHQKKIVEGNLKLVARYRLFNRSEATAIGPIPNHYYPSDHYPLLAEFALL